MTINEKLIIDKLNNISNDTYYLSDPSSWTKHEDFIELVKMGEEVLKVLFKYWTKMEVNWIWLSLCNALMDERPWPVEATGRFELQKCYYYIELFNRYNNV